MLNDFLLDMKTARVETVGASASRLLTYEDKTICLVFDHCDRDNATQIADFMAKALRHYARYIDSMRGAGDPICLNPFVESPICHEPPGRDQCHELCAERNWQVSQKPDTRID